MMTTHGDQLIPAVTEHDHSKGPSTAPVTLVEYGDYECSYCGAAYPMVQELQRMLGDRLRFVFRNFPLTTAHPRAEHAAEAAEAAGAQGKFWEMHDALFEHQRALRDRELEEYAAAVGLDVERFDREMEAGAFAGCVREDFMSGVRSGVNGTPTFFINGRRHDGAIDLETLLEAIEAATWASPRGRGDLA
jgi:protein-disulfide isomerase